MQKTCKLLGTCKKKKKLELSLHVLLSDFTYGYTNPKIGFKYNFNFAVSSSSSSSTSSLYQETSFWHITSTCCWTSTCCFLQKLGLHLGDLTYAFCKTSSRFFLSLSLSNFLPEPVSVCSSSSTSGGGKDLFLQKLCVCTSSSDLWRSYYGTCWVQTAHCARAV